MLNALRFSHQLLAEVIKRYPQGYYVDATLGNGHDSLFIASHPQFKGHLLSFDIQEAALINSRQRFEKATAEQPDLLESNVQFVLDDHSQVGHYLPLDEGVAGAIFNLGYLPGGDHTITTHQETSYQATLALKERLLPKGRIILVIYHGHPEGARERDYLLQALTAWPQDHYQVLSYQFLNQKNNPPFLLAIERIR